MCVIVQYHCQKCKKETGQRDYISHTDGQRFAIPDADMNIISFCNDIRPYRAVIHDPLLQAPGFPCNNERCMGSKEGFKAKLKAVKSQKQDASILAKLRDTAYVVADKGYSFTDVKKKLNREGIAKAAMQKLPGAKFQKWNLYTEDKLKEMTAKDASYQDIKAALKAITGLSYTTYEIITKAASFELQQSLFPFHPPRPARPGKTE